MSEHGWTLRGIAHDLTRVARVIDELDVKRGDLRRQAAHVDWDDAARSHIEGYCECADELISALGEALR